MGSKSGVNPYFPPNPASNSSPLAVWFHLELPSDDPFEIDPYPLFYPTGVIRLSS